MNVKEFVCVIPAFKGAERDQWRGLKEIIFFDFGILYQKKLDLISFFGNLFFIYYYQKEFVLKLSVIDIGRVSNRWGFASLFLSVCVCGGSAVVHAVPAGMNERTT